MADHQEDSVAIEPDNVKTENEEVCSSVDVDAAIDRTNGTKTEEIEAANCKLILENFPVYVRHKQLKDYLAKLGVLPKKLVVLHQHAYVTLNDEMECAKAIELLDQKLWKKNVLSAALDNSLPRKQKRQLDNSSQNGHSEQDDVKRMRVESDSSASIDPGAALIQSVTPLCHLPYEEQLKKKKAEMRRVLCDLSLQIRKGNSDLPFLGRGCHFGTFEEIRQPPPAALKGYRNKCEFTVGFDPSGKMTTGFRWAKYREGSNVVLPPYDCCHVPTQTKECVRAFQVFLDSFAAHNADLQRLLQPHDVVTKTGFWRQLTVRCFTFDMLAIITVSPRNVTPEITGQIKQALRDWLFRGSLNGATSPLKFRLSSLYYQELNNSSDPAQYELLEGVPYVYENLVSPYTKPSCSLLRFQISPQSFFQTNTLAAQKLFEVVGEMLELSETRTLLFDICCGTGTIGVFLAPRVRKVVGIELCADAIKDANVNAQINGVQKKCKFICGKAEDVFADLTASDKKISDLLEEEESETPSPLEAIMLRALAGDQDEASTAIPDEKAVAAAANPQVVGILDPPRCGLPDKIIVAIRKFAALKQLVYVACDAKAATKNFVDLCRQTSNKFVGEPFALKRCVPVDIFPQTAHCELVLLFER